MKIPSAAAAAAITLVALTAAAVTASVAGPSGFAGPPEAQDGSLARGRYLAVIAGCHDCHTPGYARGGGQAPESQWLTGHDGGYQGPWGTSYPANLRLTVRSLTEAQWLVFARAEKRPPMPWFSLREMSDSDLTDIYRFIRSLGPAGKPAPAAVPPGGKVNTPFVSLVQQNTGDQTTTRVEPQRSEPTLLRIF